MSKRKITFMTLLEDYFETYMPYSRGLSPYTINSYKQSFLLLLRFMLEEKKKKGEKTSETDQTGANASASAGASANTGAAAAGGAAEAKETGIVAPIIDGMKVSSITL